MTPRLLAPLLACAGCLWSNPAFDSAADPQSGSDAATTASPTAATSDPITTGTTDPPPGWWDDDWKCRRRLPIAGHGAEPLTDVPILLILDPSRVDLATFADDGSDLRFVTADQQPLAHEIERWDPADRAALWLHLPALPAAGVDVWMYWCGPAGLPLDPSAAWPAGFAAVYHLADPLTGGGEPEVRDATLHAHHGRARGGMTPDRRTASPRGFALDFRGKADDGAGDFVDLDQGPPLDTDDWSALTVEAWALQRERGELRIVCKSPSIDAGEHVFATGLHAYEPADRPYLRVGTDDGFVDDLDPDGPAIALDTWFYVALAWDARTATAALYLDGQPVLSLPLAGGTLRDEPVAAAIANVNGVGLAAPGNDRFWLGLIDEVRIHVVRRSPAWIATQHRSARDELVDYTQPDETLP